MARTEKEKQRPIEKKAGIVRTVDGEQQPGEEPRNRKARDGWKQEDEPMRTPA